MWHVTLKLYWIALCMSIQQHSGQSNHHVAAAWLEYDGGMLNSFQSHHDVHNSTWTDRSTCFIVPHSKHSEYQRQMSWLLPPGSIDAFKYSFFPAAIRVWNSLPADVVLCPSIVTFKSRLTDITLTLQSVQKQSVYIGALIAQLTPVFISFVHSLISGMHHPLECVSPNVDIILQSGRFWATSSALFRGRFNDSRSCWVVFIHVVPGRLDSVNPLVPSSHAQQPSLTIQCSFVQYRKMDR